MLVCYKDSTNSVNDIHGPMYTCSLSFICGLESLLNNRHRTKPNVADADNRAGPKNRPQASAGQLSSIHSRAKWSPPQSKQS